MQWIDIQRPPLTMQFHITLGRAGDARGRHARDGMAPAQGPHPGEQGQQGQTGQHAQPDFALPRLETQGQQHELPEGQAGMQRMPQATEERCHAMAAPALSC